MIGRCVERVKTMILVLDLRTVRDNKADLPETPHDVVGYLRQWMKFPDGATTSGQSEVGWFLEKRPFEFDFLAPRLQGSLQFDLGLVDQLACGRTVLFRQCSE